MTTVTAFLSDRGVEYDTLAHPRAFTSIDEARALDVAPGMIAKSVVLRTSYGFALAVIPGSRRLDLRRVRQVVDDRTVRLATEVEIQQAFPGVELGALPPLGSLFGVPVYLDRELSSHPSVVFADGLQTESVRMRTADLLAIEHVELADLVGRPTTVIELD